MIYIGTALPARSLGRIFSYYHAFAMLPYLSKDVSGGNEISWMIVLPTVDNPECRADPMRVAITVFIPQKDNAFSQPVREIAQGLALLKQHLSLIHI